MPTDTGYINYFEILGLNDDANPGEVRKTYKRLMKELVGEIARAEITEDLRAKYLLDMAKLNAAVFVLRDKARREDYWSEREALIDLEARWTAADPDDREANDQVRREFEGRMRAFLSKYVEETVLEAGQDKEVVEASHWNPAHARHATSLLRHYRHRLHHDVLERLPFHEITPPNIDWDERKATASRLIESTDA